MPSIARTVVVGSCIAAAAALAGCAGFESAGSGPAAEAPAYRVGDRWIYRAQDGFRRAGALGGDARGQRDRRGRDQRADHAEGSDRSTSRAPSCGPRPAW